VTGSFVSNVRGSAGSLLHSLKFHMAMSTRAIPLKMAMMKDAMAEMTALIALKSWISD
jgi:hypothetical protein